MRGINDSILRWIIATALSSFGDGFTGIAMSILTYSITSSGKYAALVFLAGVIPAIIFGPFIGIKVDSSNKRNVLVKSNFTSIMILISLIIAPSNPWIYFGGNFALSTVSLFFRTSSRVILPELVENKNNLMKINSIYSLINKLSVVIGTSIAGIASDLFSFKYLFLIDLFTFAICVTIIISISNLKNITDKIEQKNTKEKYLISFREGINLYKNNSILITCLILFGFVTMCDGIIFPQLVVYVKEHLNKGGQLLGQVQSIFLVGIIVGQSIIYVIPQKINEMFGLAIGVFFSITVVILLGMVSSIYLTLFLLFIYGFFGALIMSSWITLSQKKIPVELRGRGTTFADAIVKLFNLLGIGLSIILYEYVTISREFLIIGLATLSLFFITILYGMVRKNISIHCINEFLKKVKV